MIHVKMAMDFVSGSHLRSGRNPLSVGVGLSKFTPKGLNR